MDQKQKKPATQTDSGIQVAPREVEKINGYYKKVVLETSFNSAAEKAPRKLDGLSLKVFDNRYSLKDEEGGQLEHAPEEMWRRVAHNISLNEPAEKQMEWEHKFYEALEDFKFVPGGRVLAGAGAKTDVTFYNCFVLPSPEDTRGGIMDSVKNMIEIMARGGGVGVNLSSLRPRGSHVKGVNGTASGAVSFGALYSFSTGLVTQGGARRGALMLMLNDDHPDIEEFITVKRTMGQVTNANLSVAISDTFMEAVKSDSDWDLKWGGKIFKTVKAAYLWDLITECAWASGEPGCVFLERCNKESNTWYFENIISVNPCGEQPLPAWGVCNLGSVNLVPFVKNEEIDWEELGTTVRTAIRFMDNVVDGTPYAFEENKKAQLNIRRVGLGTMGLGDFFIKLKVKYGSEESVAIAEKVYKFIRDEAYRASVEIAKEKGSFPEYNTANFLEGTFIKNLPEDVRAAIRQNGIRNGVLLTQAPTGTTSILAGVSSGIEPVYDFAFKRTDRLGQHTVYHPLYKEYMDNHPGEEAPDYFINAKKLTPMEHLKMQAIIQKYTDASISKTVNAPESHTHEDVKELYIKAYDLGCKGVTYYRENSRDVSVLESLDSSKKSSTSKDAEAKGGLTQEQSGTYIPPSIVTNGFVEKTANKEISEQSKTEAETMAKDLVKPARSYVEPMSRPEVISGKTYKIKTAYGTMYVTINDGPDGAPFEVFATIGKTGGFYAATGEGVCRMISLALRSGISADEIIKQLQGIRGPMPSFGPNGTKVLSLPDAIASVLRRHIVGDQQTLNLPKTAKAEIHDNNQSIADNGHALECPECGGDLAMESGCYNCHGCGYSKCG